MMAQEMDMSVFDNEPVGEEVSVLEDIVMDIKDFGDKMVGMAGRAIDVIDGSYKQVILRLPKLPGQNFPG